MGHVREIGTRIELLPMDGHCGDISIGLYQEERNGQPCFRVHSYSSRPGVGDRLAFVRQGMMALGDLVEAEDDLLTFPCGHEHLAACRRAFLEACKIETGAELAPRPLETLDRKSRLQMHLTPGDDGAYVVSAEGESDTKARRIAVVANGLAKLGEMEAVDETTVRFPCGQRHDALTALLLVRAPNVRAVLREEQATSSRGVLAAPSQQSEA